MATIRGPAFVGRNTERDVLDGLMARVRGGESEVLVIHGEAGIGKSALLRHAARQASGFRVAELTGVEAEMELPFAGVHQLCATMLDRLDALPAPQRDALSVALGLAAGEVPERFLVGLAVLSLLAGMAEERPLLCLVEDAQWLDGASSQVLGLVARRVRAERSGSRPPRSRPPKLPVCWRSERLSASAILWCARRSTARRRGTVGSARTRRWRR